MIIEQRDLLGNVVYSVALSLNRIDLSEYSDIEQDFGNAWEIVLIEIPTLTNEQLKHVYYLVQDYLNPLGLPIRETYVVKTVQMLINHFFMTKDIPDN